MDLPEPASLLNIFGVDLPEPGVTGNAMPRSDPDPDPSDFAFTLTLLLEPSLFTLLLTEDSDFTVKG